MVTVPLGDELFEPRPAVLAEIFRHAMQELLGVGIPTLGEDPHELLGDVFDGCSTHAVFIGIRRAPV